MKTKPQVLVIDDDAVVGRSFDRVLSSKGYEVDTALSGEDGLKDMENTDYDVVFTDIKMPGMDGIEVAERIRKQCPWTPVVVITGYGTTENEARASVLGVSGFVRKPLTPEIIENITMKALEAPAELAAPFIALGYVIALPLVGFYMFAKFAREAYQKKRASGG
jgi:CheY-like chemotaxis protein